MTLIQDIEMEFEAEELSRLSAERLRLKVRLDLIEAEIRSRSNHFYVGADGHLEVNLSSGATV